MGDSLGYRGKSRGGAEVDAPSPLGFDPPPHQPKGPLLLLLYDINFGPTNPEIFLWAP